MAASQIARDVMTKIFTELRSLRGVGTAARVCREWYHCASDQAIAMAYTAMAYIAMAYIVMAYIVMIYTARTYI